jgi:hypothetical protein
VNDCHEYIFHLTKDGETPLVTGHFKTSQPRSNQNRPL